MNTETIESFYKPALLRVANLSLTKAHLTYEEIREAFYDFGDKAPKGPRKLNLNSISEINNEPKEFLISVTDTIAIEIVQKQLENDQQLINMQEKEIEETLKNDSKEDIKAETVKNESKGTVKKEKKAEPKSKSKVKSKEAVVERSTTPNVPPPEPEAEESKKDLKIKWFDKKRNYVMDEENNNILKHVGGEYILVGRYDANKKSLIDIGNAELAVYTGSITQYEYDNNYFVPTVAKASKPPTI